MSQLSKSLRCRTPLSVLSNSQDLKKSSSSIVKGKKKSLSNPFVNVHVMLRSDASKENAPIVQQDGNSVLVEHPNGIQRFAFDGILKENDSVFDAVGQEMVKNVFQGYCCSFLAYGQSGTGKSTATFGNSSSSKKVGLVHLILKEMFNEISRQNCRYEVKISMIEVFDKQVNDLLNPKNVVSCKVRYSKQNGPFVEGVTEKFVSSYKDGYKIAETGSKRRSIGQNTYNQNASRAHTITKIILTRKKGSDGNRSSFIDIIDLAGTSRDPGSFQEFNDLEKEEINERSAVNRSLSNLSKVIMHLSKNSNHISYRDATLTWLLKESLGGNSLTYLLATVSQYTGYRDETMSTLKFASQAKLIQNHPVPKEDSSVLVLVDDLKANEKKLRKELGRKDTYINELKLLIETNQTLVKEAKKVREDYLELEIKHKSLDSDYSEKLSEVNRQKELISQLESNLTSTIAEKENLLVMVEQKDSAISSQSQIISELQKKLKVEKDKSDELLSQLQTTEFALSQSQNDLSKLKQDVEGKSNDNKKLQEQLLKQKHDSSNKITRLTTSLEQKSIALEKSENQVMKTTTLLEELNEEMKKAMIAKDESMKKLTKEYQTIQSNLEDQLRKERERVESLIVQKNDLSKRKESEIQKIKDQQTKEISVLEHSHNDALNSLKVNHEQELIDLKDSLDVQKKKEIQNLQTNFEKEKKIIKDENETNLNALKEHHESENNRFKDEIKTLETQLNETRQASETSSANHQQEIQSMKEKHNTVIEKLKKEHDSYIQNAENDFNSSYSAMVGEYDAKLKEQTTKSQEEIIALQVENEKLIQSRDESLSTISEHQAEIKDLTAKLDSLTQQFRDNQKDSLEKMNELIQENGKAMYNQQERHKQDMIRLESCHKDEITELKNNHLQEKNALQRQLQQIEEDRARKVSSLEQNLSECSAWIQQQRKLYQQQSELMIQSIGDIPLCID